MARLASAALAALVFALALSAWGPEVRAGTPDAPEITDPAADHDILGVPLGELGQFTSADILAGWILEDADNLLVHIQITGTGGTGTLGPYSWNFQCTAGGAEFSAGATSDGPAPTGAATAVTIDSSVIAMTVPRSALAGATELTGCHIQSVGGTPDELQDPAAWADVAPDDGADAGISYQVTGGAGGGNGTAGDSDGDGLNDTKEEEQFGNLTAQNGTGDPDGDGLNNTEEFDGGTNATKADTDGDGLDDKEDSDPLDPLKPGSGGNGTGNATADLDDDDLPDSWEREHFNSTTAQAGDGDPDTDGLENKDEYGAGTDPNDADTDGDGLSDGSDPKPLTSEAEGADRLEMYIGAPLFAAIATLCLFALGRQ